MSIWRDSSSVASCESHLAAIQLGKKQIGSWLHVGFRQVPDHFFVAASYCETYSTHDDSWFIFLRTVTQKSRQSIQGFTLEKVIPSQHHDSEKSSFDNMDLTCAGHSNVSNPLNLEPSSLHIQCANALKHLTPFLPS